MCPQSTTSLARMILYLSTRKKVMWSQMCNFRRDPKKYGLQYFVGLVTSIYHTLNEDFFLPLCRHSGTPAVWKWSRNLKHVSQKQERLLWSTSTGVRRKPHFEVWCLHDMDKESKKEVVSLYVKELVLEHFHSSQEENSEEEFSCYCSSFLPSQCFGRDCCLYCCCYY